MIKAACALRTRAPLCAATLFVAAADASRVVRAAVTLLPQHLTSHLSPRKSRRRLFDSALIHSLTDDAAIVMDTRIYLTTWSKSCAHSSTVRRAHSDHRTNTYHRVPLQVEHPSIYNAAVWSYGNAGKQNYFIMIRSLYCKKTARNFFPIILSHNLGTSPKQNHKKYLGGSRVLIQRYDFLKFNMGLMGILTLWLFKQNRLEIFWCKFQGLVLNYPEQNGIKILGGHVAIKN
jgi:hypothetical protein